MQGKSKLLFGCFACFAGVVVCLGTMIGAYLWRFASSGTNPYSEIKQLVRGELIEIKDDGHDAQMGPYKHLLVDGVSLGTQFEKQAPGRGPKAKGDFSRLPTTYYHPAGPVGLVLQPTNWFPGPAHTYWADARLPASIVGAAGVLPLNSPWAALTTVWSEPPVGVIMIHAGTMAGHARPYQFFDFYDRNPEMIRHSWPTDPPPTFSYLVDAKKRGAEVRVFEGNERKTFDSKAPRKFYRFLFVETIRGDTNVVSKELLTQEAMQRYLDAMTDDGVACFHTSNRYFRLTAVVAAVADMLQLKHVTVHDESRGISGHYSSEWVFVARNEEQIRSYENALGPFLALHAPPVVPATMKLQRERGVPQDVWRDGESNSLAPHRR